jgi:cytochrome c
MAFAGVAKPEDRASLLLYLNSKTDSPVPLPAAPAADAAPAAEATAAPATEAATAAK